MSNTKERDKQLYESLINKYGEDVIKKELKRMNNKPRQIDESTKARRDKKLYESLVNKYGTLRIHQELMNLEKENSNDEIIIED